MDEDDRWRAQIEGLRSGDDGEVLEFCRRYGPSLTRLAERHLAPRLRRRLDPEDVVQSVFRTFFRRASDGQFLLQDNQDLWRLLCAITLAKVRGQARAASRKKRDTRREVSLDTGGSAANDEPPPDEQAIFVETFDRLLAGLDDEQREIVVLKLQGHTNDQVADVVGCSERTVRRMLGIVKDQLAAT